VVQRVKLGSRFKWLRKEQAVVKTMGGDSGFLKTARKTLHCEESVWNSFMQNSCVSICEKIFTLIRFKDLSETPFILIHT
jgi:hypothetical protein